MKQEQFDRWMELNFSDAAPSLPLSRRDFLKLSGGGIFILFNISRLFAGLQQEPQRFRSRYPDDFNAYLRIDEDGQVHCFTGKIEMGQGIYTSLAQMLADELDVDVESVHMVMGDTDLCPWDMGTFGSMSTRFFGPALRHAGAQARRVLLELASEHLQVPVDRLTVEKGTIYDTSNRNKRVTYGELARGKKIAHKVPGPVKVKDPSAFKVMGKPMNRRDARLKVTGEAQYAADIQRPGMLYAKILRPPAHGARLLQVDVSAAKRFEGVQVVQDGDLIAVLHRYPDVAEQARQAIKARWDVPESDLNENTIFDHLLKVAPEGNAVGEAGDLAVGRQRSRLQFEHTYLDGYVAHAPMEPHAAVVDPTGDRIMVWASTQTPFRARDAVAGIFGVSSDKVRVITPFVGGGFGGKTNTQQIEEAARIAKLVGKPVQVAWTREEEFFYDTFRPAAVVQVQSGLSEQSRIAFWDYHVYFAGSRGAEHFYTIPHYRTVVHGSGWRGTPGSHPFATGAWRAPANNTNTFARESQIDIMAHRAGMDPVEFRLAHLKDQKMVRVLKTAAERFGWANRRKSKGTGFGVALGIDAGTYVATMVEVEVDQVSGHVQVQRVLAVQDMGLCINPEGARLQMEGCITMGLGYALSEDIRFRGGAVLDRNFDTYEIPRFSWLPQIETVVLENENEPPQGGGEPAIVTMGAVIANAIYDAVGARLFQLPMTPERVLQALEKQSSSND